MARQSCNNPSNGAHKGFDRAILHQIKVNCSRGHARESTWINGRKMSPIANGQSFCLIHSGHFEWYKFYYAKLWYGSHTHFLIKQFVRVAAYTQNSLGATLTRCRPLGIQYLLRITLILWFTPACRINLWAWMIIRFVNCALPGRRMGARAVALTKTTLVGHRKLPRAVLVSNVIVWHEKE